MDMSKNVIPQEAVFPMEKLEEVLEWLARDRRLSPEKTSATSIGSTSIRQPGITVDKRMDSCAAAIGIEVERFSVNYKDIDMVFTHAAPAIITIPSPENDAEPLGFIALIEGNTRVCSILKQDYRRIKTSPGALGRAIRGTIAAPYRPTADILIERAGITPANREKVIDALVNSWLSSENISLGWYLRPSPASSISVLLRNSSPVQDLAGWIGAFTVQELLYLLSWWFIGRSLLSGQTNASLLWIWILLLISMIPFQLLISWQQNKFSQSLSVIFKQKLLYGALKINPDDIRHLGTGQMLQRVMQIESVEMFALGGGISAVISFFQLLLAGWVLSQTQGGLVSLAVLTIWIIALLFTGWLHYRQSKKFVTGYRSMTNHMVEKMIGHRTRLAQEKPLNRHEEEDIELVEYQALSQRSSISQSILNTIPSSWLLVGIATLIPSIIANRQVNPNEIAIGLGGIIYAYQGFLSIQSGLQNTIQLLLNWEQVKPIYAASNIAEDSPALAIQSAGINAQGSNGKGEASGNDGRPMMTVRGIRYSFQPERRPVLKECSLDIYQGDRLLLEGPSGGGKTTFAAVLAGLRKPNSGLLFLHGYDYHSIGEKAWRERIVLAPQFHENHIFNDTFAFNLLMGRRWPALPEDYLAAKEICVELGLMNLLERMPSGWQQIVGENGWQLSHGERSRVFIARALLQDSDLVIMDESFGALDPENLYRALGCAQKRAQSLLVIAHP